MKKSVWLRNEKSIANWLRKKKYKNCFLERYQPFDREIECGKQDRASFCCWPLFQWEKSQWKNINVQRTLYSICEKDKILDLSERSVFQLLGTTITNKENDGILTYTFTKKTYSTMMNKVYIHLYSKQIRFLVKELAGLWQKRILTIFLNRKDLKKVFKLWTKNLDNKQNNSIFGYDCQNSIENCYFESLSDGLEETLYLKKRQKSVFDAEIETL